MITYKSKIEEEREREQHLFTKSNRHKLGRYTSPHPSPSDPVHLVECAEVSLPHPILHPTTTILPTIPPPSSTTPL